VLDQLATRLHLQHPLSGDASGVFNGLLGAGQVVLSALASGLDPGRAHHVLRRRPTPHLTIYRLVPHSRRPRAILLGDEIHKVGGYVRGNLLISLIAGALPFGFLVIAGVPYALLLSIFVAILDLIPVIAPPSPV
jgi:predicted PurR-regulated permease PerM